MDANHEKGTFVAIDAPDELAAMLEDAIPR